MPEPRSFSPWWALLLLPVAAFVGWFAGGMPVPDRPAANATQAEAAALHPDAPTPNANAVSAVPVPATEGVVTPEEGALYSTWTTFDTALHQSHANGKAILLDFNAEWCGPCQNLQHEVFDHEAAGTTVKAAVIPVSVVDRMREDGMNSAQVEELQHRFKVEAFPTLVIFSPATGRVVRQQGYAGSAETLRWITEGALAVR